MDDSNYTWLPQPDLDTLDIGTILQALADPVRLEIVRSLDAVGETTCSALAGPVKVSTISHHMHVLRNSGLISTRLDGTARPSRLRKDELDRRFPGFLASVIHAAPSRS
jgi:DNA-binding transcriptional ArsR family regulator